MNRLITTGAHMDKVNRLDILAIQQNDMCNSRKKAIEVLNKLKSKNNGI